MKNLIRRADKLAATLRERQFRRQGLCPKCGKKLTPPMVISRSEGDLDICFCKPITVIDMTGPSVEFKALDIETGLLVEPETLQAKYKKDEVQDDE